MENLYGWLLYRGLRAYLGKWRSEQWQRAKRDWKKEHPRPPGGYICALCNNIIPHVPRRYHDIERIKNYQLTFDHIIPIATILYGDQDYSPMLLFSQDNIQPTHFLCNLEKGAKHYI